MSPHARAALIVIALSTLLRALAAHWLPLTPDEAYYWQWSRELAWGYFDHPPMVAWLIGLSTYLFGDGPLALRLPAVFGMFFLSVLAWYAACEESDEPSALWLVIALSVTPLTHLGGVIITPDSPLVVFWALLLVATYRAFEKNRMGSWFGVALFLALGILSKYTMLLAVPLLLLLVLLRGQTGSGWRLTGAFVLAGLLLLPHLLWLNAHDWPSVRFQAAHLTDASRASLAGFGGFVAAQIGLLSPGLLWLLLLVFRRRAQLADYHRRLLPFVWFPLLVALVAAGLTHAEAGWGAVAYIAGIWLVATEARLGGVLRRPALMAACLWGLVFTLALYLWAFGLAGPSTPARTARDMDALARQTLAQLPDATLNLPMTAQTYRLAALWSYIATPDRAPVAVWPLSGQRRSQLDRRPELDLSGGFLWLAESRVRELPEGLDPDAYACFWSDERLDDTPHPRLVLLVCTPSEAGGSGPPE